MTRLDDETLNAYADGELEADERARVEGALAGDPDARSRLEAIRRVSLLGRAAAALFPAARRWRSAAVV